MEKAFILPGEMGFFKEPTEVSTVLGSCIAVCLHSPSQKFGGLNHYVLPNEEGNSFPGGKIGSFAIKALVKEAMIAGCNPKTLHASIYGGAKVITTFSGAENVGDRNIDMARKTLSSLGIPVKQAEVGGTKARRVYFNTATNEVRVVEIQPQAEVNALAQKVNSMAGRKTRVLVVDDSSTVRKVVIRAINAHPNMEVVGEAESAYEARERIIEVVPDVISLDIIMPKMNGLDFLKRIMYYKPIPTVILSTIVKEGNKMYEDLKRAGALHIVNKDDMKIYQNSDNLNQVLIPKLIAAAKTLVHKKNPNA